MLINLNDLIAQPRRKTITLTASNAALPIPSWAQGGKGLVYVTGVGGGGGGGAGSSGQGGGGAEANRHPVLIPAGVATLSAVVASGGAVETNGGATSVAFGAIVPVSLAGGNGASGTYGGMGGRPSVYGRQMYFLPAGGGGADSTVLQVLEQLHPTLRKGIYGAGTTGSGSEPTALGGAFSSFGGTSGYGAGGGANSAGQPGLLILEFVEGF